MDFDLKSPCNNCPFRRDCLVGWLGEDRAKGIIKSITEKAGTFRCHKTGRTTGGKKVDEQHCAGAIIFAGEIGASQPAHAYF